MTNHVMNTSITVKVIHSVRIVVGEMRQRRLYVGVSCTPDMALVVKIIG